MGITKDNEGLTKGLGKHSYSLFNISKPSERMRSILRQV